MKLQALGHKLRPSTRHKVTLPPKKADSFYLSAEWRAFMDALIIERFGGRDNARCEDPQCRYLYRRGIRIFGDHVKERKDGGAPFDQRNIRLVCGSCHTRKTAAARALRLGS